MCIVLPLTSRILVIGFQSIISEYSIIFSLVSDSNVIVNYIKKTNKQLLNRNLCLFVDLQHNKQNNSPALFGGVRVAWSLPFCVKFCRSCLFFCPFVFLALCSFVLFLFGVVLFVLLSFWRCVVWPLSFWRCVVCRFVFLALCCLAFCLFGVVLFVFFLFTPYNYPFGISKLLLVGFVLLGL
jgi:hypothetical protein